MRLSRALLLGALLSGLPAKAAGEARPGVWSTNGPYGAWISSLALDPSTRTLYAGTWGSGIFRSRDGARYWAELPRNPYYAKVTALAADPSDPNVLIYADRQMGVSRTADDGKKWETVAEAGGNIRYVAVDPKDPAFVAALGSEELFTSTDAGKTWSRVPVDLAGAMTSLIVDPGPPRRLVAQKHGDVVVSTDGGISWAKPGVHADTSKLEGELTRDPGEPGTFYAASRTGVQKSTDGGKSWTETDEGLAGLWVNAVALDARESGKIYAATRWGRFRSLDAGKSWRRIDGWLHEVKGIAVDPLAPDTIYSATAVDEQDLVGPRLLKGRVRSGLLDDGAGDAPEQGYTCVAIDPRDPKTVWAGSVRGVRKSTDAGATWPSAGLENEEIVAIAFDPRNSSAVFAASKRGGLFKSVNGGEDWSEPSPDLKGKELAALAIPSGRPDVVYVATHGSGLFRSADGGASFTKVAGLPYNHLRALLVDPSGQSLVVGTNGMGIYTSGDGGGTWLANNPGLTALSVTSIDGDPRTGLLVIGTTKGVFVRSPLPSVSRGGRRP
jgi:photosystem II stability/assembly factor-like uncharacterized protein